MESAPFSDGNVGEHPVCLILSGKVKRLYTEVRLVVFRNGFIRVDPLYVSHDDRVSNMEASLVLVDSPFIHHEALHVLGGGAFLCYE